MENMENVKNKSSHCLIYLFVDFPFFSSHVQWTLPYWHGFWIPKQRTSVSAKIKELLIQYEKIWSRLCSNEMMNQNRMSNQDWNTEVFYFEGNVSWQTIKGEFEVKVMFLNLNENPWDVNMFSLKGEQMSQVMPLYSECWLSLNLVRSSNSKKQQLHVISSHGLKTWLFLTLFMYFSTILSQKNQSFHFQWTFSEPIPICENRTERRNRGAGSGSLPLWSFALWSKTQPLFSESDPNVDIVGDRFPIQR